MLGAPRSRSAHAPRGAGGAWRPVVAQVADTFLARGVREHGCARIRCDACALENPLVFACQCRYLSLSCHVKRLAIRTQWLATTRLALVHDTARLTKPFGRAVRRLCVRLDLVDEDQASGMRT